jgi:hypothetical protein
MNEIQQPMRPPVSSSITIPRLVAIFVLVFGLTALGVRWVAAMSESAGHAGHTSGVAAKAGPPLSIEQLAATAGCTPKIQTEAAELRQGYCPASSGSRYFITTFTTTTGQQQWLEQAQDYAAQLVGNRWIVASDTKTLQQLQPKLGGDIVNHHAHGSG